MAITCRWSCPGHKQVTHTSQCLGFPTCKMGKLTVNPLLLWLRKCSAEVSSTVTVAPQQATLLWPNVSLSRNLSIFQFVHRLLVKMMTCKKPFTMSSLLSHQQQEDPGAQRELVSICPCVCSEGCGETSSWAPGAWLVIQSFNNRLCIF